MSFASVTHFKRGYATSKVTKDPPFKLPVRSQAREEFIQSVKNQKYSLYQVHSYYLKDSKGNEEASTRLQYGKPMAQGRQACAYIQG
jgi:hypothetical protein